MQPLRLVALAGAMSLPATAHSQNCELPALPDATVTAAQDRDHMMCALGLTFPSLPPRLEDPHRPANAWPVNIANPEGNWTDPLGHTVVRTSFGLWHTYDSDAGAAGGAMSGFGDYGPFSSPRYTDIPLLKMKNGTAIESAKQWWLRRRPEIRSLVQQQFYGEPIDPRIPIRWEVSAETSGVQAVGATSHPYREKTFTGTVDVSSYPSLRNTPVVTATCRYPAAPGRRYPAVVTFGEGVARFEYTAPFDIGVCNYTPGRVQPDNGNTGNLSSYLIGLVTKGQWRKPDDPGALVAWGWGVSRLIDKFASDPDIDGDKIAVEGHSRYGKATLVTAAYDERVVVAWPSDAGAMGTAMMRRHWGETLEFVASSSSEYHWVNGNILKYAGPLRPGTHIPRKLELLDVDAHSTTSLLAPRAIFVTNGTDTPPGFGDAWSDPRGTFISGQLASPVWELLGWKGQVVPADTAFTSGPGESVGGTPPFNVAFIEGTVGWRRQIEGHVSAPNWPTFATFAARYLNDARPTIAPNQRLQLGEAAANSVGKLVASDADASDKVGDWQIKGGSGAALFDIDANSGEITVVDANNLNFSKASYALTVIAGDGKLPSHDTQVTIEIPESVNVCHRGRTLPVPKRKVRDHLSHDDAIGGCLKQ